MSAIADLARWLDERADQMADFLIRLVSCQTENPPGRGLLDCARVLREELVRLDLDGRIVMIEPSRGLEDAWVVLASAGMGDRLIYFHGHFDVVPAQDRSQFTARRSDGRIAGRGTADMKGGIVSMIMIYGAAAAQGLGLLQEGRIVLHLVCDEETGSAVGSQYLRTHSLIDSSAMAMLTAEQSGEVIWNAAKGALSMRVDVLGKSSHVGRAFQGVNAFVGMLKVALPLELYAREMSGRHTRLTVGEDEAPGSMVLPGGQCGGGSNFNVVPDKTYFTVDAPFQPRGRRRNGVSTHQPDRLRCGG